MLLQTKHPNYTVLWIKKPIPYIVTLLKTFSLGLKPHSSSLEGPICTNPESLLNYHYIFITTYPNKTTALILVLDSGV